VQIPGQPSISLPELLHFFWLCGYKDTAPTELAAAWVPISYKGVASTEHIPSGQLLSNPASQLLPAQITPSIP
jgi:hypothetical protein